eukprot:TRINITY_DN19179_c0_g1_i1.p1 TRINITY_DN19179_c0_g1~~TRINITY_DN19179_c0_g1_i1.p1  ORF type:complete len:346 (-),score=32.38 TRINITY_DN19179_c0_g1_i1:258-1295(-)
MIRRPPRSTLSSSSAASDVYKRQLAQHRVARALRRTVWSQEAVAQATQQECRPWDREDLIRRLRSFQTWKWFGKPSPLSAMECARHGWTNSGVDTLTCQVCKTTIRIKTPVSDSGSTLQKDGLQKDDVLKEQVASLSEGHSNHCGWRQNPCHDSVMSAPIRTPAHALLQIQERYDQMQESALHLADLCLSVDSEPQLKQVINQIQKSTAVMQKYSNTTGLVLALVGWSIRGDQEHCLTCHECTRTIGVWNFQHRVRNQDKELYSGRKRKLGGKAPEFNPIQEHYWYCPWVSGCPAAWSKAGAALLETDAPSPAFIFSPDPKQDNIEPISLAANVSKFLSASILNH